MKYIEKEIAPGVKQIVLAPENDDEKKPGWLSERMCDCNVVYDVDNTVDGQLTWRCPKCGKELTLERKDD